MLRSVVPAAVIPILLMLAGCDRSAPTSPSVTDAWVRLPAVAGRPAAAYFTVKGGNAPDRLVAIESDKAGAIELHEGGMRDGVAYMARIDGVDVPAGGLATFAPGGNHAMIFDPDPAVRPGDGLPLRFRFRSGTTIDTMARTSAAGEDAPAEAHEGHDH